MAVSRYYRRQSIASKLVKISFKLLEKWNDNVLYAAVDCSNIAAITCYQSLGFVIVLDERELINRKASAVPRLFMKKTLNNSSSSTTTITSPASSDISFNDTAAANYATSGDS